MKTIAVMSTKGGVGKTRICASLGRAISKLYNPSDPSRLLKVGFFDMDWVAPTLHIELKVKSDSKLSLSNGVGNVIQPVISPEGYPLVSSAFIFPDDQAILADEESKVKDILELTTPGVIDWGGIDYLMVDTPPSTEKFIQSALKISGLHGVVLVSQPAVASLTDLIRTVSLMRDLQIPVIGMIGNQVYLVCPHDGERINLYDLGEEDLSKFCSAQGVPFLGSIPHVLPEEGAFDLNGISEKVISQEAVILKRLSSSTLPYKLLVAMIRKRKGEVVTREE